jgi:hypothetical protein
MTMKITTEGSTVEAKGRYDKRWRKAKVLWIEAYHDDALTDVKAAYLQFSNGARGLYDDKHMRIISSQQS